MADAPISSWLVEEWTSRLAGAIELMTEVRPEVKVSNPLTVSSAGIPESALWYVIPFEMDGAAIFLGAAEESWFATARAALLAAGITEVSPDARGTYLEIVTQAAAGLAQAIAARLGKPIASLAARQTRPGADALTEATTLYPVDVALRDVSLPARLYLGWTPELEAALIPKPGEPAAEGKAIAKPPAVDQKSRTLDLLMEVELPVSVSFGRAELPLRDVLKLNSGSIVELNRTISDPVEIIVNNCVIARGEVVVVDGNYGVRIQHVVSREERLRTLK